MPQLNPTAIPTAIADIQDPLVFLIPEFVTHTHTHTHRVHNFIRFRPKHELVLWESLWRNLGWSVLHVGEFSMWYMCSQYPGIQACPGALQTNP